MAVKTDRYFYVPAEKVCNEEHDGENRYDRYLKAVEDYLAEFDTHFYYAGKDGKITSAAIELDKPIPDGFRVDKQDYIQIDYEPVKVNIIVPDKRTKAGKAAAAKLQELNSECVSDYVVVDLIAKKYGLYIVNAIQDNLLRSYQCHYLESSNGYTFAVPANIGTNVLDESYEPHSDIREITKSQYIALVEEGKTIDEV